MANIEVIEYDSATGELKEVYDEVLQKRGQLAEVIKIHSLSPGSMKGHIDFYMSVMFSRSPLKRYLREVLAVVVSNANHCKYCITHHSEAVNHFWKDADRVALLTKDYTTAGLTPKEVAFCDYAYHLTKNPSIIKEMGSVEKLKMLGASDKELLDTTQIVAYFNFVNRMVLGLEVGLEENAGEGFLYD